MPCLGRVWADIYFYSHPEGFTLHTFWAKTRMVEKGPLWLSHPTILLNYIFAFSKTSCSNHFCHTAPSFYNQWANHKNRIQSPSLFFQDVPFFRCFLKLTWKRKGKIKYERYVKPNDVGKFFWKIVNVKCKAKRNCWHCGGNKSIWEDLHAIPVNNDLRNWGH